MPTFYPEDFDIDVEQFVDDCDSHEITELIEYLRKQGYLNNDNMQTRDISLLDMEWAATINKISGNARLRMTTEEEETIRKIANRF